MKPRFSASALERVEACPPSAVLPNVGNLSEAADVGSAGHEHMMLRARVGVDDAVACLDETIAPFNLPEDEIGWLRSRIMNFTWSPPPGSIAEIRLALMPDGTVQRVPGEARFFPGALFTGKFDVLWAEPEPLLVFEDGRVECPPGSALMVVDYKFGQDRYVPSIENNPQASAYAVLAARWTGARVVVPAVLFPGAGDGEWDVPSEPWGEPEITAAESRIRGTLAGVDRALAALEAGEPLELVEGRHCEFCPALTRCPAKTAMLRAIVDSGCSPVPLGDSPLSESDAAALTGALQVLGRVSRMMRAALEAHVRQSGPVPLGDGLVWGPEVSTRKRIVPARALPVLQSELGEFVADAVKTTVSGSGIEQAVKRKLAAEGRSRGVAPIVRRIYGKLYGAEAVEEETRTEWHAYRAQAPELAVLDVDAIESAAEDLDPDDLPVLATPAPTATEPQPEEPGEAPIFRLSRGRRGSRR